MANKITSYKDAISELEEIVNNIENEAIDVDELAGKVDRASKLLSICSDKLKKTEEEVDKVIAKLNADA
jgi:exodeoxyribonuclease VII small subunit|tara:strand:- start:1005 stop:1211 length:207 start_codon:yes stop_codon:yes gene_type:complete